MASRDENEVEKKGKSFTPGTQFEAGPSDPKPDALPPELSEQKGFCPKNYTYLFIRFDIVVTKKMFHIPLP